MDLKKIMGVFIVALLAVGFAIDASAQTVASPAGVTIRVSRPDSGAWVGIGDSVVVEVKSNQGLGPAIDNVIITLVDSSSAASVPAAGQDTSQVSSALATDTSILSPVANFRKLVTNAQSTFDSGTSVRTFRASFIIAQGDQETGAAAGTAQPGPAFAVVYLDTVSATGLTNTFWQRLDNRATTTQSNITGFNDRVGDGKRFGVDGQRPVNATYFDSVLVDTLKAKTANPTNPFTGVTSLAKAGDNVAIKLRTKNIGTAGVDSAVVFLFPQDSSAANISSASPYRTSFPVASLVSGIVRDSFNVSSSAAGKQKRAFKNNERIKAVAFLVDKAGNLSGDTASGGAIGFSQSITLVMDSTLPTVALAHKSAKTAAPDSNRFTGKIDTTYNYIGDNGTLTSTSFSLRPLKFSVNEGTTKRVAYFGGSSDSINYEGSASTAVTSFKTSVGGAVGTAGPVINSNSTGAFRSGNSDSAGRTGDLTVYAVDSVGNRNSATVATLVFDELPLNVQSFFPNKAAIDTINNATRFPLMRINEVADSISVRFVQVGVSPPDVVKQALSSSQLTTVGTDISVSINDTLLDNERYSIQVYARDLAGNISVVAPGKISGASADTLVFDKEFNNPGADSFVVAAGADSVVAGANNTITLSAIDSALTRKFGSLKKAVTYSKAGVLFRLSADTQSLSTVTITGTGVTDLGNGVATLSAAGWVIGARTVNVKSEKTIDNYTITVEDTSTTVVDGESTKVVNFKGTSKKLSVDASEFTKYWVQAWEDGVVTTQVSGDFQVSVVPSDKYNNPSTKRSPTIDTQISKAQVLGEVFVLFGSNMGDAQVPAGPQGVKAGGSTFTAVGPDRAGEGLVISVRTTDGASDTTGANAASGTLGEDQKIAVGSVTLSFLAHGSVVDPNAGGELAAPDTLVVQDWLGANGTGDQGGFVLASFPKPATSSPTAYRIYREVTVTTDVDTNGKLIVLTTPVKKFISWTAVAAIPGANPIRAVVPTLDGIATRWAVASETGGSTSGQTVAGKRVFTKQIVQNMVQLLGVDPNLVLSTEELSKVFAPSTDYVKSIIGDREGVVFAALDPNFDDLTSAVPTNIRTQTTTIKTSPMTTTTSEVKAVDNIAPAAVATTSTGVGSGQVILTWSKSTDDKVVGYMQYSGYSIPIPGVDHYEIWRGQSETSLEMIASVPAGSTTYTDANLPSGSVLYYRVNAADLDNLVNGPLTTASFGRPIFLAADGSVVIIVNPNGSTPYVCDFEDFITFAVSFNKNTGESGFTPLADTNDDGVVDFTDFIVFAQSFNKTVATIDGQPVPSSKPVVAPQRPGVNDNVELSLSLNTKRVLPGETVTVNVALANATSLQGFGFNLRYDSDKFEFVEAVPAANDLLKAGGSETPIFLQKEETGRLSVANAIVDGSPVSGAGQVVTLTFRVLREFEDDSRFEIANGVVFDGNQLANPAVAQGSLSVQSTPVEFALLQNFPNPFNPETTIKYNLADETNVHLRIYNVVGQVVRTLVAEPQGAGRYTVRWNGTDDRGVSVSSGIYFYQLTAGKFQDVRKLMLLK